MKKIDYKKASNFVSEFFNQVKDTTEFAESIYHIANGLIVRCVWEPTYYSYGTEWFVEVFVYDQRFSHPCGNFNTEHWLGQMLECVESAVENFYPEFVQDCIKHKYPIALPGCPCLYWDKKKKSYYIQHYDNERGGWKEWVDPETYAYEQAVKSDMFWF